MIINWLCCGYGEQFLTIMEWFGFFENWAKRKEYKEDQKEYYGLTPEQIEICKAAKEISKIKYEAAIKVRWDEIAKRATRPNDSYHRELFKRVLKPKTIEMTELHKDDDEEKSHVIEMEEGNNINFEIKPGTPRRRKKRVFI